MIPRHAKSGSGSLSVPETCIGSVRHGSRQDSFCFLITRIDGRKADLHLCVYPASRIPVAWVFRAGLILQQNPPAGSSASSVLEIVETAGLNPNEAIRHTATIHLVQAGVDLIKVTRISGHKTLSMAEHYYPTRTVNLSSWQ
ncbi:tyrosine-type recombinase/integrase [Candidatus Nitrotoga fabula]|uniref:tyrosine-type recombinase/integrase n=1 Tax=Candidatus Nitrotoga fabula TaxID=2182327 RepID=UPI001BB4793C|nr:tyrosine-type recombinase/integrase [Candidatus Nitrotoga fabula]